MRLPAFVWSACLWGLGAGCAQKAEVAERQPAAEQQAQAMRDRATLAELHALVRREYRQQDYAQAKADIALLGKRYPHAQVYPQLAQLTGQLDSLSEAQRRRAQARRQRRGQAGAAPGPWQVAEYQDEFRKPAGRFYLTNAAVQWGETTTLTADSTRLAVQLLVDSSAAVHLVLYDQVPLVAHAAPARPHRHRLHLHHHAAPAPTYHYTTDYAQMEPVRAPAPTRYTVKVRGSSGTIYRLVALNPATRLEFDAADSRTLHACLLEGGEINFAITPDAQPTTTYRFTLANADAYEAGYRELLRR